MYNFNDLQCPSIVAFPYQKDDDQKYPSYTYIPMYEDDFIKAMKEIHVNTRFNFNGFKFNISVVEEDLENFILDNSENSEKTR